jgi:hypothetical protein
MMRVLRPRPKRPRRPSLAMTSRALAMYPMRVSFTCRYVSTMSRGSWSVTNLAVRLDDAQGVADCVADDASDKADERLPEEVQPDVALRNLRECVPKLQCASARRHGGREEART